ncbi:MAG: hypothetical protein AABW48_05645 [Nanoarchaeota archaeon]
MNPEPLLVILFLLFLAGFLYFFYKWRTGGLPLFKRTHSLNLKNLDSEKTPSWLNFNFKNSAVGKRIKELKQRRAHKKEIKQREDLLAEFGPTPEKKVQKIRNPFTKLSRIVKYHRPKQKLPKINHFQHLEAVIKNSKRKNIVVGNNKVKTRINDKLVKDRIKQISIKEIKRFNEQEQEKAKQIAKKKENEAIISKLKGLIKSK